MKLKQKPGDFRVLEVLQDGIPRHSGEFRVYRVTKTKLTTIEAAEMIAREAGVEKRCVQFAGLKDRQGVTVQYISVEGGKRIVINEPGLKVEHVFDCDEPVESEWVKANAFDITVRELHREDIRCFDESREIVKEVGVPNYFDDQRFGSLRHGQGFVAREMIEGQIESALKRCLLFPSPYDPPHDAAFKGRLRRAWGEWEQCVKLCRGGKHLSVFEHLVTHPEDFAGAFRYVSQRLRLIHLYAFQSYLWNESVSAYLRKKLPRASQVELRTDAGSVVAWRNLSAAERSQLLFKSFPLLAPDVKITDPEIREAVMQVLEQEGLTLARLKIPGVEGFAFKAEDRALAVVPRHMRVLKPEDDSLAHGLYQIRVRFELPRGSYATMVVKRLFITPELVVTREPLRVGSTTPLIDYKKKSGPRPRTLRESGEIPKAIRGDLKFVPKRAPVSFDERDAEGKLTFRPKSGAGATPPEEDDATRDADGKLTFEPKGKGGARRAPRAFDRDAGPSDRKPFGRRPPGGGFGRKPPGGRPRRGFGGGRKSDD